MPGSFAEILAEKECCYYHHRCGYNYWKITERNMGFFPNHSQYPDCPFLGGLNQLWRNQLLGLSIESDSAISYRQVPFSVVHHPGNHQLAPSIQSYLRLFANNPKFSTFTSSNLVQAARDIHDPAMNQWAEWYSDHYNI